MTTVNDDLKKLVDIPTDINFDTPEGCLRLIVYLMDIDEFDNFIKYLIKYQKAHRSIFNDKPEKYDAKYWINYILKGLFSTYVLPLHIKDFLYHLQNKHKKECV